MSSTTVRKNFTMQNEIVEKPEFLSKKIHGKFDGLLEDASIQKIKAESDASLFRCDV